MTIGRLTKKERRDDQLRMKRALAATGLAQGATKPLKAIPLPTAAKRLPAGFVRDAAESLQPHRYPLKKVALGKPQSAGDR